ncbi:hypothetical protein QE422_001803 [Chryseobacterium sp. SORGH_AS 447]|nr:hypothetical protein [Chryseobacterium sp. SORGH_AS_0447]
MVVIVLTQSDRCSCSKEQEIFKVFYLTAIDQKKNGNYLCKITANLNLGKMSGYNL